MVMMVEGAGLQAVQMAGMEYSPLKNSWRLTQDLGINYIAYFKKPYIELI